MFKVVMRGAEWIETTLAGETNDANQFRAIPFGLSCGPGARWQFVDHGFERNEDFSPMGDWYWLS
jgi:hypothetical protein